MPKHNPNKEPKFHHIERLEGAGRSTNALFITFKTG
jgi:hypothetical protein